MNVRIIQKEELETRNNVIADQQHIMEYIESNFTFKVIYKGENIKIYKING
jgi:hypothetical protein